MTRILILFAHPALEKSRIHRQLIRGLPTLPGITLHDLYEQYPDFDIDIAREQTLLIDHDLIILQHPFYWYSTPALLKQWQDLVLEHGWAYGSQGKAVRGKQVLSVISTGGGPTAYQADGLNRFTMRQLLAPLEQTFYLCGMTYHPPYLVQGTHRMIAADIEREVEQYRRLIITLHNNTIDWSTIAHLPTLNHAWAQIEHTAQPPSTEQATA
jgi:glutathione-regulated potassium-efflux system ancillary protein KefG